MPRPGLPKLIATDLDGTLVRSDDTVSAYTHQTLDRVRAAGIPIVGATGRGPRLTELTRNDIRAADYLVLAGGGRVIDQADPAGPVVLRDERLDGSVLAVLLADLEAQVGPLTVMVEALDSQNAPLWGDQDPAWRYPDVVERRTREDSLRGTVIKAFARTTVAQAEQPATAVAQAEQPATAVAQAEQPATAVAQAEQPATADRDVDTLLAAARRIIPPALATVTQAGLAFVEICPPGVDKATGLAVVAQNLGVDPADVLVFGDMPNDVPMMRWAGWGRVAVANAHPDVLALADEVTSSNDEDGVAAYLDRLLSDR